MSESGRADEATGLTFHLARESVWTDQLAKDCYMPEEFADEGFIHTTNTEKHVLEVANRYYRDDPGPFVLLDVDLALVRAQTIYEDAQRQYPHVFGGIDRDAVTRVRRVNRNADGTFVGIGAESE